MTATALAALAIILTGAWMRRAGVLRDEARPGLVAVVIYVAMPALVFLVIVRAHLTPALMLVPVAGLLIHSLLVALMLPVARLLRLDRPSTGAFLLVTAGANTGFFGLPLIVASGDEFSHSAAAVYDAVATGLTTWVTTVAIAAIFSPREGRPGGIGVHPRTVLAGLFLPPMWALLAGIVWNLTLGHDIPLVLEKPLEIAAAAVLPVVMIYVGAMIDLGGVRRRWRVVSVATVLRLGLGPVMGLGVGAALGLSGPVLHTVVILSAMPSAMMSLVLGAREGLDADILVGTIVATALLSTLTLPLVRMVMV